MGSGEQPSKNIPTAGEEPANKSADQLPVAETAREGQDTLSPIAQAAVDNQTGVQNGDGKPKSDNGNQAGQFLEIPPIKAAGTAGDGTGDVPVGKPPAETAIEELSGLPLASDVYRDGRSDRIDLAAKRVAVLPRDDNARQLVLRELAESFENPQSTYAEKLAAARALIDLTRQPDGKVPDNLVSRDVLINEQGSWQRHHRSRKSVWKVSVQAHHEMQPLRRDDVTKFLDHSAETIERETTALKDAPADSPEMKQHLKKLATVFQTYGDDTPEKLAAAKALKLIKGDGAPDEVLSIGREIFHPAKTRTARNTTIVERAAYTEHVPTTRKDVEAYLSKRSESIVRDTALTIEKPQDDATRRELATRSSNLFLDSKNPEDKTAAAVALLELGRGQNGAPVTNAEQELGSRIVRVPAETRPVAANRNRGAARTITVKEAYDRTDSISQKDVVEYLRTQLAETQPARGRLMAADALKRAGALDDVEHKRVLEGILTDDKAPEAVKVSAGRTLGLEQAESNLKKAADGRDTGAGPESIPLDTTAGGERDKLKEVLNRMAIIPDMADLLKEGQLDALNRELDEGRFGPNSRDFYNKTAGFLSELSNGMAVGIVLRGGKLPPGLPIELDRDASGRAQGDDVFRAQLITGRAKVDIHEAEPGDKPDVAKLSEAANWTVKAANTINEMQLRFEVKAFDEAIERYSDRGSLDKWKSTDGMSVDDMRQLQAARGEWINLAMQTENYAQAIAHFNKATQESVSDQKWPVIGDKIRIGDIEIDVQRTAGRDSNIFPDEALQEGVFPGTVKRVNGRITEMSFDLPRTLERTDENVAKMNKLKVWLEKYGPLVDQVTREVSKGSLERGRLLMWGDIPEHEDKIDPKTGQKYNAIRQRFETETVQVKLPNGEMEERTKVTNSIQKMYFGDLSYQGLVGDIREIGEPERSGDVKVNGRFVRPGNPDGVAVNARGEVQGEGGQYVRVRVENDGRILMRKVDQANDLFIAGKRVEDTEWHEVFPDQTVSLGKPRPELGIGTNDAGKFTFNGQVVEPGTTVDAGRNGPIKVDDPAVGDKQAQVRVDALGRVYIKDNGGGSGTYVNGKSIAGSDWTMIDPSTDRVSFGKPAVNIDIDSDVRLYRPTDWVTVLLDNQMQVMPASNLADWQSETKRWHYGGKAAMIALDVGMIVTGTIELKAVQVALQQAGKQAGKTMLTRMMAQQGFKRGLWHVGLGATGLAHQSIENLGPGGKKLIELRGYAMMGDIFLGGMVNPAVNLARAGGHKIFGLAKPIEKGSHLNAYLKTAPIAKGLHRASGAMFFGMNFYFVPEVAAHQIPGIRRNLGQHNSETLLKSGALLREKEYKSTDGAPPPVTVEDLARRHTSDDGRDKITAAKAEAKEAARLPEADARQKQEFLNKLAARYIDSKTPEDRLAAAFGLLTYHAESSRSIPDVLATRTKEHLALPENVTSSEVKAFIESQIPRTLNLFDKQLQDRASEKLDEVILTMDSGDPALRKQLNDKLLGQFVTGKDDRDRVAAATALLLLNESGGQTGDGATVLGSAGGADGQVQVKVDDLGRYLEQYHQKAVAASFDSYAANAMGDQKLESIFRGTREVLERPADDPGRKDRIANLESVYKTSTDPAEKAAAGLSLLFLNCDLSTGAFSPTVSASGLRSDDIVADLKGSMASLPTGMRLTAADFLYRAGEAPYGGPSAFNDLGGVLLSVVTDKSASPELKKQALINAHGIGLADVFEMHRFQTEPGIKNLGLEAAGTAEADLYGRDSKAIEKALTDILSDPNADKDLRALASATLLANSEPTGARRAVMMGDMQTEYEAAKARPGSYYDQLYRHNSDLIKSAYHAESGEFQLVLSSEDNKEVLRQALTVSKQEGNKEALSDIKARLENQMLESKRIELFRAALILSETGNWKEFGVKDEVLAAAFHQAFLSPEDSPILARQAFDPLLKHYDSLSAARKDMFDDDVLSLMREPHKNRDHQILRLETFGRLKEVEKAVGGTFGADARSLISNILTKGSPENLQSDENLRAAAVIGLSQIGSNDKATRDLLTTILGGRGDNEEGKEPSATVRSLALDRLLELKPPDLRETVLKLLTTETDREIIGKLGDLEFEGRRLDPDSSEYRERYRQAYIRMMEAAAGKYALTDAPGFIDQNYKLLNFQNYSQRVTNLAQAHYGGEFKMSLSAPDHQNALKPFIEQADREMNEQLRALSQAAQKPDGDMARRALTWIVMSNAKSFEAKHRDQVIKDASFGLYKVAESGDAKAKEQVGPLLTMALATQDRMPSSARLNLLYGLTHLHPGTPGSPVSKEDAGVAVLAALERQFHRTPRDGNDPGYPDSHKLQTELLNVYKRFAGPEAIPILEAIAEEKFKFDISRNGRGLIEKVNYPDNGSRLAKYDENNRIWQVTIVDKHGNRSSLIREGKSNQWFLENNHDRTKPDFEGGMEFDQETGAFRMIDAYNKETVYTTSGATINKADGVVNKVTYPNGSSRELIGSRYVFTDAAGNKQVWNRQPNSNTWITDDRKKTWIGEGRFDTATGDYIQKEDGKPAYRHRTDGGYVQFDGERVITSSPGAGDESPHPMPVVREIAQAMLADLRDNTSGLFGLAQPETGDSPEKLNEELKAVLQNPDANSEQVIMAIFKAGRSAAWVANDPRRETIRDLLSDPHERIQLAAARMLFSSSSKEDVERVAQVVADIHKNGSRKGFRDDAGALLQEALKDETRKETFDRALASTPDRPRLYSNLKVSSDRPPEHQEVYERTKGDLIRDTQISMEAIHDKSWWVENGYNLLHEESYLEAQFSTADDVSRNKITFWNKLGVIFSDGSGAKAKFEDAVEGVKAQRGEQFDRLLTSAEKGDENARQALAYIVLSNGFPLRQDIRSESVDKAASKLAMIYEAGGSGADYAEKIMEAALVANPGIDRSIREKFVDAVIKRLDSHASHNLRRSNGESTVLLMEALKAEQWAMPKANEAGYSSSISFQSKILDKLRDINLGVVTPELEAVAAAHGNAGIRDQAKSVLSKLRDEARHILADTVADTSTDNREKADRLAQWISKKQYAANDETLVREMFKLAHPSTFSSDEAKAKADPRIEVLKKALEHENDRVRLAAALILREAVPSDPRAVVQLSTLRDSARAGIQKEANELYEAAWQKPQAALDAESADYVKQMLSNANERVSVTAARMMLGQNPHDVDATVRLARLYGSAGAPVIAEARAAMAGINNRTAIEADHDTRRRALTDLLNDEDPKAGLAAAWMLSHSKAKGDLETATAHIAKLAVKSPDAEVRQQSLALLEDMIYAGGDNHQALALAKWNEAWNLGTPDQKERRKPPAPTDVDQGRKYYRQASQADRTRMFSLPESERKAIVMHATGLSEAELEARIDPGPVADILVTEDPFSYGFGLPNRGTDLFSLTRRSWDNPLGHHSRFQAFIPGDTTYGAGSGVWDRSGTDGHRNGPQFVVDLTGGRPTGSYYSRGNREGSTLYADLRVQGRPYQGVGADRDQLQLFRVEDAGRNPDMVKTSTDQSRMWMAHYLQTQARQSELGDVMIGRDGTFVLKVDGNNKDRPVFVIPGDDKFETLAFGQHELPPEFSEFLTYMAASKPEIFQQPSIKAADLSVMFLQYLRAREAGIKSGLSLTPNLYDTNVEYLTRNPRAAAWYHGRSSGLRLAFPNGSTQSGNQLDAPTWKAHEAQRQQKREAKLNDELRKALESGRSTRADLDWKPNQTVVVAKPEFIAKPPVEMLRGNQLAASGILPPELLTAAGTIAGGELIGTRPGAAGEIEIPVSRLQRYMVGDGSRVVLLRDLNGDTGEPQQFQLSPQAQRILDAHRRQRVTETMYSWNRHLEKYRDNK